MKFRKINSSSNYRTAKTNHPFCLVMLRHEAPDFCKKDLLPTAMALPLKVLS
jgi:hypothetical protein